MQRSSLVRDARGNSPLLRAELIMDAPGCKGTESQIRRASYRECTATCMSLLWSAIIHAL